MAIAPARRSGRGMPRHTVGNAVVLHGHERISAQAQSLAMSVVEDPDHLVVVLDMPEQITAGTWESVASALPRWRRTGIRLVICGDHAEPSSLVGQWLSERLSRPVVAPHGTVTRSAAGSLFVHSGPGTGWIRYRPGREPQWEGKRFPRPVWDATVAEDAATSSTGVAEPVPGGVWIHDITDATALESHRDWLLTMVPCQPDALVVLLGCPGTRALPLDDVYRFWRRLNADERARVRFVGYGPVDLPGNDPLGQGIADALSAPVVCYAGVPIGVPAQPQQFTVDDQGRLCWQTFAEELAYTPRERPAAPARTPRMVRHRIPLTLGEELEAGVYRYAEDAVVEVLQSGLWVRPAELPRDADQIRATLADAERHTLVFDDVNEHRAARMRTIAEDVAGQLDPATRERTELIPASAVIAAAVRGPAMAGGQISATAAEEQFTYDDAAAPMLTFAPPPADAASVGAGEPVAWQPTLEQPTVPAAVTPAAEPAFAPAISPATYPAASAPAVPPADSAPSSPAVTAPSSPFDSALSAPAVSAPSAPAVSAPSAPAASVPSAPAVSAAGERVALPLTRSAWAPPADDVLMPAPPAEPVAEASAPPLLPAPTAPLLPPAPATPMPPTAPPAVSSIGAPTFAPGTGEMSPAAPITPAAPIAPSAPTAPTAPGAPTAPTVLGAPAAPTAPTEPFSLGAPTAPTAPAAPFSPAAPDAPFSPAAPVAPISPAAPVEPITSVEPAAPVAPARPAPAVTTPRPAEPPPPGPAAGTVSTDAPATPTATSTASPTATPMPAPVATPDVDGPRLQPVPDRAASALITGRGLTEERAWLRRTLSREFDGMATMVSRVLSEHPGLQGGNGVSADDVLTDSVAVRLYLSARGQAIDSALRTARKGPHVPFARCAVAGLTRLPSHRGATVFTAAPTRAQLKLLAGRTMLTEWGFLNSLAVPSPDLDGDVDVLVWSMTGRRTSLLEPDGDDHAENRVLFLPGTSFKVVDRVEPSAGRRAQLLLREVAPNEINPDGRVQDNRASFDELATTSLRRYAERWAGTEPTSRVGLAARRRLSALPGLAELTGGDA